MHEFGHQVIERAVIAFEALCAGSLAGPELQLDGALPTRDGPLARCMFEDVLPAERFKRSHARMVLRVELESGVCCQQCHFGFWVPRSIIREGGKRRHGRV